MGSYTYHVPDGILTSPPSKPRTDMARPGGAAAKYEIVSPGTSQIDNMFAVDLSSLGYDLSPHRLEEKEESIEGVVETPRIQQRTERPLVPKRDMAFSIEHSLNAMLEDEDITKSLFSTPRGVKQDSQHGKGSQRKKGQKLSP